MTRCDFCMGEYPVFATMIADSQIVGEGRGGETIIDDGVGTCPASTLGSRAATKARKRGASILTIGCDFHTPDHQIATMDPATRGVGRATSSRQKPLRCICRFDSAKSTPVPNLYLRPA